MNNQPIFIIGAHKSGTSLLRSLLDGHPELFAIPIETHFFFLMHFPVDYQYRRQYPKKILNSKPEIQKAFIDWIKHNNQTADPWSDAVTKGFFSLSTFRNKFNSFDADNLKSILINYFEAIYASLHKKELSQKIRVVEKSVEHAEFVPLIHRLFPDAKFVHIIRNPYANLVSLRKFKSRKNKYPLISEPLNALYNNWLHLNQNKRIISNYLVIKYETLVTNPKTVMQQVSSFLDIKFDKLLLKPTLLGENWVGNSTSDENYSGISATRIDKWKSTILPLEIFYVNKILANFMRSFGYNTYPIKGSFWKPIKGESVKRYIQNRLYKSYLTKLH